MVALFGLSTASPLLALTGMDDTHLPACCRRLGAHHCTAGNMQMGAAGTDDQAVMHAKAMPCPYCPAPAATPHFDTAAPGETSVSVALTTVGARTTPNTERRNRTNLHRNRPKRGPPVTVTA